MTFIATVVAKKGAALIADSLVTTSRQVLEFDKFISHLKSKTSISGDVKLDVAEVIKMFSSKPSFTKDYYEKLFQFNKYTAIATAGAVYLNGKTLEQIISFASSSASRQKLKLTAEKTMEFIRDAFAKEILECHKKGDSVRDSILIITHYNRTSHKTTIGKLFIWESSPEQAKAEGFEPVILSIQHERFTVVCEGQNRISEKILWGDLNSTLELIPNVANKIFKDFNIPADKVPKDYVDNLINDRSVLPLAYYDDMKINKLSELSLQQAIDLACLLMKIERDIQKFTENIPTVGGNVKTAIIDGGGFRFISGDELTSQIF